MGALVFGLGALAHSTLLAHSHQDLQQEGSDPLKPCCRVATLDPQLLYGLGGAQGTLPPCFGSLRYESQRLSEQGHVDRALDALLLMDQQGITPSVNMYRSLLKACAKKKSILQTKQVHAHLSRHGLESSKVLGEDLVSTFVKCGAIEDAGKLFHRLPHRSVFCWTALISGYASTGQGQEALGIYKHMQEEGVQPNAYTFVSLLKACGSVGDLEEGKRIHAEASIYKCEADLFVGTGLVDMYGKCGSIADAKYVFDGISQRDVVAWNAMLAAYVEQRQAGKALELFDKMRDEGVNPSKVTYLSVLQACGMLADSEEDVRVEGLSSKSKYLERGKALHADICRSGFDSDVFVGSALVTMYGKCRSIVDAQRVFVGLPQQNMVACTCMLAAYVHQGHEEKALQLFELMLERGISPDARTFVIVLQACGMLAEKENNMVECGESMKVGFLRRGKAIHADAQRRGFDSDVFVGNTLISMYSRCGSIVDAQGMFEAMHRRDVVSWNTILWAHVDHGQGKKAWQIYEQMQETGQNPDKWTFVSALQACAMLAEEEAEDDQCCKVVSLQKGKALHAHARKMSCESDALVRNALITMYGKCRSLVDAQRAFDMLSGRNVVAWTAMLAACVEQGQADLTLQLFEEMEEEGVSPNDYTLVSVLQACSLLAEKEESVDVEEKPFKVRSLEKGKAIHTDAQRRDYDTDVFVCNALVSMYGKCGSLMDAEFVFGISERNVATWTGMLMVYVEQGQAEKAWHFYEQMQQESVSPDVWTCVSALQACAMLAEKEVDVLLDGRSIKAASVEKVKAVQADVRRRGYDSDNFVVNTLISLYGKCGSIADAQSVFDGLSQRNVVSWNALLAVFVGQAEAPDVLQLYAQMQGEGVSPNNRTFVSVLQAYGMIADSEDETVVHGQSIKADSLEKVEAIRAAAEKKGCDRDVFVASTLVRVYGKCGNTADARTVFDMLPQRNVVSWNAMLSAYVQQGQADKALQLYRLGQQESPSSDESRLVCILHACGKAGSLGLIRQIHHTHISTRNHLSPLLANTLILAYGRCSSMVDAQTVFDALPQPNLLSWTALIAAYARGGYCVGSLGCYNNMLLAGVKPDAVTFVYVLSSCSHAGLVNEGVEYFQSMSRDHGITPGIEHYAALVDLFGRAGWFTRLEELLSTMPVHPDLAIWLSVLGSCQKHGKVVLGERAFHHAMQLKPKQSAAYVLMSNILDDAGLVDRANEVMALRKKAGVLQVPGRTWIEEEQTMHTFGAGDCRHSSLHHLLDQVSLTLIEESHIIHMRSDTSRHEG